MHRKWTKEGMNQWIFDWMNEKNMNEWMNKWTTESMNKWMTAWLNEQITDKLTNVIDTEWRKWIN